MVVGLFLKPAGTRGSEIVILNADGPNAGKTLTE